MNVNNLLVVFLSNANRRLTKSKTKTTENTITMPITPITYEKSNVNYNEKNNNSSTTKWKASCSHDSVRRSSCIVVAAARRGCLSFVSFVRQCISLLLHTSTTTDSEPVVLMARPSIPYFTLSLCFLLASKRRLLPTTTIKCGNNNNNDSHLVSKWRRQLPHCFWYVVMLCMFSLEYPTLSKLIIFMNIFIPSPWEEGV